MGGQGLWKYCAKEQWTEFLLSLNLLGNTEWPEKKQLACLYAVSNHAERHYHPAAIPKKDGSQRLLWVPDPLLKKIQKQILRQILNQLSISPYARAYRRGAAISSNAAVHVGKKQILKLDIQDFFDNIQFEQVYRFAFPSAYFPPPSAALLTYLCCYRERLPQGAPTSPAISNLVMRPFDDYMGKWCQERGINYSRYCDDMTFSGDFDSRQVKKRAENFLKSMGFELNGRKTRNVPDSQRQVVTGIVVNRKPQADRDYRRRLRQELYYCRRYGMRAHLERIGDQRFLPMGEAGIIRYRLALLGKIQFILQVNPEDSFFLKERDRFAAIKP